MSKTNHAVEAKRILAQTLSYADNDTEALVNIGAAQVQATLALSEQQRIANLIELTKLPGERTGFEHDATKALSELNPHAELGGPRWRIKPDVKEVLGLPEKEPVKKTSTKVEEIVGLLDQYGDAARGDWSFYDGRDVQSAMWEIEQFIRGQRTLSKTREWLDLCPHGEGHWTRHCEDDCGVDIED